VKRIDLNSLVDGINYVDDFIIYKDGLTINVCRNECKHMGGRFKGCSRKNVVECRRHQWKLNMETLRYENPVSLKQDAIPWKIENDQLLLLNDTVDSGKGELKSVLNSGEFRIKFYSHACVEILWNDNSFFTDPWMVGPAFTKGWWLSYLPPKNWLEKLSNCDGIYISHNHSDHMNIPTLRLLVKENPLVKIFVPNFTSSFCFDVLSSIGFKEVEVLNFNEEIYINDMKFTLYEDTTGRDDSAILLNYKGCKILNTVDCKNIKSYDIDGVDILLSEFSSGASGYPVCWNEQYDDEHISSVLTKNRNQIKKNIVDTIRHFNPKVFVPFAGYFSELYESDYNIKNINIKNSAEDINTFVERKFPLLNTWLPKPGKELDLFDLSSKDYTGDHFVDLERSVYADEYKHGDHIRLFDDIEAFQKYFNVTEYTSDLLLHIVEMDENFSNVYNEFYVDFNKQMVVNVRPDRHKRYLRIKVRSDVFRYVLFHGLPWEEFSIGFQARFYREPDNYNLDFWDYFQNELPTKKLKEIFKNV
tara:strand:+ start:85 stop:1674 length:1590 start_codon:yes stop_codon:yes gene_type:complete